MAIATISLENANGKFIKHQYLSRGFDVTTHSSINIAEKCCYAVLEASGNAMMLIDKNGVISKINDEFAHLSGFTKNEVENRKSWTEFLGGNKWVDAKQLHYLQGISEMVAKPTVETFFNDRDGRTKFVQAKVRKISKTGKYIVSFQDNTEIRNAVKENDRLNSEISRIKYELAREIAEGKNIGKQSMRQEKHDHLTGLPNRDLLIDSLKQAFAYADRHGSQIALMFLDLDEFSKVNDMFGHISGDILLQEVAKRLRNCTRQYDTIARIAGDELVVFINDMKDIHDIVKFTEKVRGSFRLPFNIMGHSFNVTSSIGVAIYPLHCTNCESLLKMAEIAMCQAKNEGKNTFRFFSSSMGSHADEPERMEATLRSALESGEFLPHYQPRINASTGMITGMEALLRWQRPEAPLSYPIEFLSLLEESGLIVPVGEWFLEKVCRQVKAWQVAGFPPFRVSVNLSARQLRQENLAERVSDILDATGLDPQYLKFEMTEQIIMDDIGASLISLKSLKEIGITIAIGNFGTGLVSLRCLNMLPFDELKIDTSFIKGIASNSNDAKVVSASIALGRNLGKMLVADGVDSRDQYDFLTHHRCEEMQGYFFSRPLPSEVFDKWCVWSDLWGATVQ